ncbi:phage tail protein [Breznakia sp. OttesenSCG-928-G09]|nr:phage tail protein [Breznakia sp. OttesenSCG-928-G09]
MAIENKRPQIKETVGAQYVCFALDNENGVFNGEYEAKVEKTEVVKSVSVTENATSTKVRASGKDYEVVSTLASTDISVEVVAFPAETLAKMRGDVIDTTGLIMSGGNSERPYFAYGKVVELKNGFYRYEWYPKCKLTANTDEVTTSDVEFAEQNDTFTISAMAFNDNGDNRTKVETEFKLPEGLTEEKFFSKPILSPEDLAEVIQGA